MAGTILMDLSKAFHCLSHDLIAKLEAYGIEKQSLLLLLPYLQQRKQSVKVKGLSGLLQLIKSSVPQGGGGGGEEGGQYLGLFSLIFSLVTFTFLLKKTFTTL